MKNKYFSPIYTIISILNRYNIPHELYDCYEGFQIRFNWCDGDVACHNTTYGADNGYVETFRFPWDNDDVSMLKPKEAAEKICNYYKNKIILKYKY